MAEPKELHTPLIQGYMDAVILRDIITRYKIANADIVQKFLILILKQLAAPLSITKIYRTFQSLGLAIGKNSLFDYFKYFEDAYAIISVPIFSLSEKIRQVNPKKLYAIDPGIITAYSVKRDLEQASRLENSVFMHLRRRFKNICYYKTEKSKKEIDFLVTTPLNKYMLFQACVEMDHEDTRERAFSAILEGCRDLDLKEGLIVTEDHEETLKQSGITIQCIPFWKWAQSLE